MGLLCCVEEQSKNTSPPYRSLVEVHRFICKKLWGAVFGHTKKDILVSHGSEGVGKEQLESWRVFN